MSLRHLEGLEVRKTFLLTVLRKSQLHSRSGTPALTHLRSPPGSTVYVCGRTNAEVVGILRISFHPDSLNVSTSQKRLRLYSPTGQGLGCWPVVSCGYSGERRLCLSGGATLQV